MPTFNIDVTCSDSNGVEPQQVHSSSVEADSLAQACETALAEAQAHCPNHNGYSCQQV